MLDQSFPGTGGDDWAVIDSRVMELCEGFRCCRFDLKAIGVFHLIRRNFLSMNLATGRQDALRFWGLGACAVLLSAGSAFSFLHCMANGMVAGDLIGLPGRQADVASAQRLAGFWLTAAVCCLGASSLAGAFATRIYEEASRLPRLIARTVVSAAVSFVLAVLIGLITVSVFTASHHSVVR